MAKQFKVNRKQYEKARKMDHNQFIDYVRKKKKKGRAAGQQDADHFDTELALKSISEIKGIGPERWISSTASGKVFVESIVAKLANRENHTAMDTLRQGLYLRLTRAEGDMRARRDASSGRRRIKGEIPEGLRSYIAWCRDRKEEE